MWVKGKQGAAALGAIALQLHRLHRLHELAHAHTHALHCTRRHSCTSRHCNSRRSPAKQRQSTGTLGQQQRGKCGWVGAKLAKVVQLGLHIEHA